MASLVWNSKLDPTVDLMNIHFTKIDECIKSISADIIDVHANCVHTNGLINQLEQLCEMHFMYEETILEGMGYPAIDEHKILHKTLLKEFEPFKASSAQCHSLSFINDFIKLRMDFVKNLNSETMKLCDFITGMYC